MQGSPRLKTEKINIIELLHDAVELFLPLAQNKNIDLTLKSAFDSLLVKGSKTLLQRVISNLLDNAIKYTPENGTIRLEMKESPPHVNISIINSGETISKEHLPHIFKPFYRADKSRSTQGNGLGLSLARSIILAHAGDIFVKSDRNHGNRFTFLLPLAH